MILLLIKSVSITHLLIETNDVPLWQKDIINPNKGTYRAALFAYNVSLETNLVIDSI